MSVSSISNARFLSRCGCSSYNWLSGHISDDYSTDEEYLNTIAGFEDDSDTELEKAKKTFNLLDTDSSGQISLSEFLEYSRNLSPTDPTIGAAKRLDVLEKKVEENGKKLDMIFEILMKKDQQH